MRAIQVRQTGGPEVLEPAEVDIPEPGPGQVRVDLTATGVNFIEIYQRMGRYQKPLPFIPGTEGAGVISAVGEGVESFLIGDRVAGVDFAGAYAASALASAERLVKVPDEVDLEVAAAAVLQGMTAHYLLLDSYRVRAGDTVLVHAAAGGMGLLLTQLAKQFGATVIGTVSTQDKERLAKAHGADHIIRYTEQDIVSEVKRITAGKGVDAVFDAVGKDTFDASLASLRMRGTLVLYGAASGPVPPFDPMRLQDSGSVFLTRPTLFHHIVGDDLQRRASDLFGWIVKDGLKVQIHERYPLAEAARAHSDLASRKTTGKLLLVAR